MALIRKAAAGSDSFGHVWPKDGATVEIDDPEQIAALMAITDPGFSEVTPDAEEDPENPGPEEPQEKKELSEVDPEAPADEPEAKPAAKKTAARKTTAAKE